MPKKKFSKEQIVEDSKESWYQEDKSKRRKNDATLKNNRSSLGNAARPPASKRMTEGMETAALMDSVDNTMKESQRVLRQSKAFRNNLNSQVTPGKWETK
jgi:hypothetical protein